MTATPLPPPLIASYRIQLTPGFGFADTIGVLDHLLSLGISHLYLSPVAEAVPGSLHGYDVVDHTTVRDDFGGEDGLDALLDAAHRHGLGVVIDHVPNHMSVAEAHLNERWWEMLRDGPAAPAAAWFDVDWEGGDGRVIVPKLGDPLSDLLARNQIEIGAGDLGPELRYGPLRFPLARGTEHLPVAEAVERQHYRLQWWRDPARNVRRFFTIDDLVAVRAEEPDVAAVIDTIPARLADHPAFAGVRVDHVDGLAQPEAYLHGLRRRIGDDRWLLVEKILADGEMLPPSWPVEGTTGYEHLRVTEHTFLDPAAERPLTDLWTDLADDHRSFADFEDQARREVLAEGLRPDLDRLLRAIAADDAGDRILDLDRLRDAVTELIIGVHRYRTYLPDDAASVAEFVAAHERALEHRSDLRDDLAVLVETIRRRPAIATRWEQLCSPVMAKGAEDRAFYRYLRLASLCEVGGAPGQWTTSNEEFHRHQLAVQDLMPTTMLAGTTHDTKRAEGVRARSLALAEVADEWAAIARSWIDTHDELVAGAGLDRATALLALQTAVTAWPIGAERLTEYLVKSTREAHTHTSWTDPDESYERSLAGLCDALERELVHAGLDDSDGYDLAGVVLLTLGRGWEISLASLAVRLTAPGVPDLYQGTAAFTYSLVDPDNRVEPDWDERRALVDRAAGIDISAARVDGVEQARHAVSDRASDIEAAKAVVITRTLALRRRRESAFGPAAGYAPLEVVGERVDDVLAFARTDAVDPLVVTIVAKRAAEAGGWANTAVLLPEGEWRDVLTDDASVVAGGAEVPLGGWLDRAGVAVLERTDV